MIQFARINPVNPPNEKLKRKPMIKNIGVVNQIRPCQIVANQLNIFIPVGIAIIDVAVVK
jgi:hypothetical protein